MSTTTTNLKLFKYDTSTDANVAFSITKALNNNWDIIDAKCGQSNNLLDFKWCDHLLNDMSWLRADTFSWQSGTTYSLVYNELLSEYNNSASTTKTEGSITFKRTPKGYKIALSNQETAILNKYNSDGIAWVYILDIENKRFKLPRTKWGFKGLRGQVGDLVGESLPNIKGSFGVNTPYAGPHFAKGVFSLYAGRGTSESYAYNGPNSDAYTFDASRSSSTYQDGAPVQERATQMYLYFYVGGFTKSAEAQTAGLKAELLNGKLDISNIKRYPIDISDKSLMPSWYVVYSDGWCEQGGYIPSVNNNYTLTLLKAYNDLNYCGFITTKLNYTDGGAGNTSFLPLTNSTVKLISGFANGCPIQWHAFGYIR